MPYAGRCEVQYLVTINYAQLSIYNDRMIQDLIRLKINTIMYQFKNTTL